MISGHFCHFIQVRFAGAERVARTDREARLESATPLRPRGILRGGISPTACPAYADDWHHPHHHGGACRNPRYQTPHPWSVKVLAIPPGLLHPHGKGRDDGRVRGCRYSCPEEAGKSIQWRRHIICIVGPIELWWIIESVQIMRGSGASLFLWQS